jgi:hypothetical protein
MALVLFFTCSTKASLESEAAASILLVCLFELPLEWWKFLLLPRPLGVCRKNTTRTTIKEIVKENFEYETLHVHRTVAVWYLLGGWAGL